MRDKELCQPIPSVQSRIISRNSFDSAFVWCRAVAHWCSPTTSAQRETLDAVTVLATRGNRRRSDEEGSLMSMWTERLALVVLVVASSCSQGQPLPAPQRVDRTGRGPGFEPAVSINPGERRNVLAAWNDHKDAADDPDVRRRLRLPTAGGRGQPHSVGSAPLACG